MADADAHAARELALDAARRAASITPLIRMAATAGTALASAERGAATSTARVVALTGRELAGSDELTAYVSEQVEAAARVRALQPRVARLEQVTCETDRRTAELESLDDQAAEIAGRRAAAPAQLTLLRESWLAPRRPPPRWRPPGFGSRPSTSVSRPTPRPRPL